MTIESVGLVGPLLDCLCNHFFSHETFCTQSQNYGGKSSRVFGRISLPS